MFLVSLATSRPAGAAPANRLKRRPMNWLTNFVRPKIRALVSKKEVPDNLWHKCPSCEAMIFHREMEENLHVCQHCGFHMRLGAEKRLKMLFDDGAFTVIELPKT